MTTFYRTTKGNKAHATDSCAHSARRTGLRHGGNVLAIPASELAGWVGCRRCCSTEQMSILADLAAIPAKPQNCKNSGVKNSKMIYGVCRDCGKQGKTNRSTGALRAHLPLAA